jgi:hypothetical protein
VERGFRVGGSDVEECEVELLGEVVAELVKAVDVVLNLGDGVVGGMGVAGGVLAVPEIEVGLMLAKHELFKGSIGARCGGGGVMAMEGGLIMKLDDVYDIEHRAERSIADTGCERKCGARGT